MTCLKKLLPEFSRIELTLWLLSVSLIVVSFLVYDGKNCMIPAASIIGITSIIICATGNPLGQLLMVLFSIAYAFISFKYSYYGEMVTYLGMTTPMAIAAFVSWIKNPFSQGNVQVKVNTLSKMEYFFLAMLTTVVTVLFYFILRFFGTANLVPSTLSVTTSFLAAYLVFRRSEYFSLFYALNDTVLIILWILASIDDKGYLNVVACFSSFLANDIYSFFSWKKMKARQNTKANGRTK